jgi:hypothetical protein
MFTGWSADIEGGWWYAMRDRPNEAAMTPTPGLAALTIVGSQDPTQDFN